MEVGSDKLASAGRCELSPTLRGDTELDSYETGLDLCAAQFGT